MTNWLAKLNDAWTDLLRAAPVALLYRTKLLSAEVSLNILVAVRAIDNAPCLILQTTVAPHALFELGGMRLQLVTDGTGTLLVLSLEDESRRDLFSTICADVVAASHEDDIQALDQFLARLDAWRQFLRDCRSGLSRSDTIGLIGELLILEQLLSISSKHLSTWQAPNDGLHDFHRDGHALEAKTSLGPASSITISKLDQLDTSGLRRLDLLNVRLIEAPDGRSLQNIITTIAERLPDEGARRTFKNALLRRGLMPDDNAALRTPKVELRTIVTYTVSQNFPRLVRMNLPIAITEASYTLDVRSLAPFSVDTGATIDAFVKETIHE
ncbi:PD-(D/E)XK motif protein [Undibacterium sp. Ji42W]|uniref:PD-(D/E)XK motif protein n=1 Tax=Undibacterium sp. Ji42W TaxID=3413039 RepID=UPI003BEFB4D0